MIEFGFVALVLPAFIAGLLTFLAPCTLPLVPGYLGFISGASLEDLKDPEKVKGAKKKIFRNGLLFVLGFSAIFILFGVLAGFAGHGLLRYQLWLARIGGIFVIIFGLFMLNVIRLPFLQNEKHIKIPKIFQKGHKGNSFILGATFGLGWTPCVGPILGSILLIASTQGTALQGAFLLATFSLGLAIPFLLVAVGIGGATKYIKKISKYLNVISIIGGVFLIFLGILMVTNNFGYWVGIFYQVFDFVNYEALLDYL